jgi:hypothetical protein
MFDRHRNRRAAVLVRHVRQAHFVAACLELRGETERLLALALVAVVQPDASVNGFLGERIAPALRNPHWFRLALLRFPTEIGQHQSPEVRILVMLIVKFLEAFLAP